MTVLTCKRVEAIDVGLKLHWEYSTDFAYWRYNLAVLRSNAEAGPFEKLVETEKSSILEFVDYSTSRHPSVLHYYKLQFIDKENGNIVESDVFSQYESQPNLIADNIREDIYREFVLFKGEKVIIYKIRRHGVLCDSFDPIRHTPKYQNCKICYDTGYIGGYYNPIYSYADFNPQPDQISNSGYGDIRQGMQNVMLPYYPRVHPGDIIITKNHVCYEVTVPTAQTLFNKTLVQFIQVKELAAQNVVYDLPFVWEEKFSYGSVYYDYKMDIPTIDDTRIDNIILPDPIPIVTGREYKFNNPTDLLRGTNLPDLLPDTTLGGSIEYTTDVVYGGGAKFLHGACAKASSTIPYEDNLAVLTWSKASESIGQNDTNGVIGSVFIDANDNGYGFYITYAQGVSPGNIIVRFVVLNVINNNTVAAFLLSEVPANTLMFLGIRHYIDNSSDRYKVYIGVPDLFFLAKDLPVTFATYKGDIFFTINNACENGVPTTTTGDELVVDNVLVLSNTTDLNIYNLYADGCAVLNKQAAPYSEDCSTVPGPCFTGN